MSLLQPDVVKQYKTQHTYIYLTGIGTDGGNTITVLVVENTTAIIDIYCPCHNDFVLVLGYFQHQHKA